MLRLKSISFLLSLAIPLAVVAPIVAPSTALAAPPDAAAAPTPRTTFSAPFQRYLLAPNGRPMGLMLADGTFIFTPGHTLSKDAPVLQTGAKLDVEGAVKRTATGAVVKHAVVKVNGSVIADASKAHGRHARRGKGHHEGGKERHGKHHVELKPVSGAGQVAAIVSSPKGRVHALVLTDGTTAVAHNLETLGLKVGDRVSVSGMGGVYPLGKSVRIEKITLPNGQTRDIPRPVRPAAPPDPGQGPA
jgi:hypothetical protein